MLQDLAAISDVIAQLTSTKDTSAAAQLVKRLQELVPKFMADLKTHMEEEEAHVQPVGRKHLPIEVHKQTVRRVSQLSLCAHSAVACAKTQASACLIMEEEEAHVQPLGRKHLPVKMHKQSWRRMRESMCACALHSAHQFVQIHRLMHTHT